MARPSRTPQWPPMPPVSEHSFTSFPAQPRPNRPVTDLQFAFAQIRPSARDSPPLLRTVVSGGTVGLRPAVSSGCFQPPPGSFLSRPSTPTCKGLHPSPSSFNFFFAFFCSLQTNFFSGKISSACLIRNFPTLLQ